MAKQKKEKIETDSAYFLKIVLYILLGMLWLRFAEPVHIAGLTFSALPIGLVIALLFIRHEHFQIDRKIEYPIVIIVAIISSFTSVGIVL
jgi:hypothetical protein